jgi:2-dehydro-3-deoxygalactonokinase
MSGRTDWADGFIAVDWGTTNRRAYLIGADDEHTDEFEDGKGILSVSPGGFEQALQEVRDRLGVKPMLLAGMIGSNRGWVEAPYVGCPAGIAELADNVVRPGESIVIVPGVSFSDGRADVMRGEEVQLLGAVASGEIPDGRLVCHPGTHNKWVRVAGGRIESFRTVMTGELFNLLRDRSILSDLLAGEATPDQAFRDGVERGFSGDGVTSQLFEARARFLLGRLDKSEGASFVSGLLIGADVRVGLSEGDQKQVIVMGRPELTKLYSAALAQCGVAAVEVDGERAFIAGARKIVELLQ